MTALVALFEMAAERCGSTKLDARHDASLCCCVHEKVLATGPFVFLLGADVGPGFSSTPTGGIQISASGSFVATGIYHANSCLSVVVPVRI
jgi:hypothetical protein